MMNTYKNLVLYCFFSYQQKYVELLACMSFLKKNLSRWCNHVGLILYYDLLIDNIIVMPHQFFPVILIFYIILLCSIYLESNLVVGDVNTFLMHYQYRLDLRNKQSVNCKVHKKRKE